MKIDPLNRLEVYRRHQVFPLQVQYYDHYIGDTEVTWKGIYPEQCHNLFPQHLDRHLSQLCLVHKAGDTLSGDSPSQGWNEELLHVLLGKFCSNQLLGYWILGTFILIVILLVCILLLVV